ncbi:zinc knuckle CX2CX4HX4C containing protein, partial [Tanacetum coccineum]
ALIEVSSETALMDSLVVDIPFQDGSGHTMKTIDIDYEWQPSRCDSCKIFDHNDDQCPKKVKVAVPNQVDSFDTLMEKDKNFEVNNEPWKATNDIGSKMDDSDNEEVKIVFLEDKGKHMELFIVQVTLIILKSFVNSFVTVDYIIL